MFKNLVLSFCVLFSLAVSTYALAATYYASPAGTGTLCALGSPCTLNTGLGKLAAGDTLYLRGGTYQQTVSFSRSGTSVSRITIAGYPDETAIIDGYDTIPSGCYDGLVTISGSYVTFRDMQVNNSHGTGVYIGGAGSQIIHVSVNRTGETGVVLYGTDGLADRVTVVGNGNRYGTSCSTWGSALCTTGTNCTIQNSVVHDNVGEGLNAYSGSVGATIQDNVSYNNKSVSLYLDSSSGAVARRNLIYYTPDYASPARCLTIGGETGSVSNLTIANNFMMGGFVNLETDSNVSALTNVTIAYNTFVNARGNAASGYNMGVYFRPNLTSFINSIFKNNIVIEEGSGRVPISLPSSHSGFTLSYNNWNKAAASAAQGAGDVVGDPKITKGTYGPGTLTGDYFKILADSPARDKGTTISGVTDDFFRSLRPVGAYPDMGGHEYGGTNPSTLGPPTNLRVLN